MSIIFSFLINKLKKYFQINNNFIFKDIKIGKIYKFFLININQIKIINKTLKIKIILFIF